VFEAFRTTEQMQRPTPRRDTARPLLRPTQVFGASGSRAGTLAACLTGTGVVLSLIALVARAEEFMVGRETPVRISVAPSGDAPCNVEILLPEGSRLERELRPPRFEAMVGYTPRQDGPQTIVWEGRFRFNGSLSVSGCSGRYFHDILVRPSPELVRERWSSFLASMVPQQRECVEFGTGLVPAPGLPTPRVRASNPNEPAVRTVASACERFVNLPVRNDVPCPVSKTDDRQTRCTDQYVVGSGRKARVLDRETAMRAAANGAQLTLVLRETDAARAERLEAERLAREKAAADEEARLKAEEDARVKAEEDARKKAEAEAKAKQDAEKARLAELERIRRLRCIAGRCFDLGF